MTISCQLCWRTDTPPNPAEYALFIPLVPIELLISLWNMQAAAVSGSLYFRRATMLKTLTLGFGLSILTMLWGLTVHANSGLLYAWWAPGPARVTPLVHVLNALQWIGLPAALWLQALLHLEDRELQ